MQIRLKDRLLNPPVEVEQLRPVTVNQVAGTHQPVVQKLLVWRKNRQRISRIAIGRLRRSVKLRICRVLHIGRNIPPAVVVPPVLRTVAGHTKGHIMPAYSRSKFSDNIAFRAHFGGSPFGVRTVIHREAVMMLSHRHNKRGTRPLEQSRPFLGIKLLCCELRNEILIAKSIR